MQGIAVRHRHFLSVLLIVLCLGLWSLRPVLLDPYQQTDDFRNLHEVHRLLDPELFPHQVASGITFGEASPAYFQLLAILSRVVTPFLAGKLLGLLLLVTGAIYSYRLGVLLVSAQTGVVAAIGYAVFNLAAESEISAIGGLQRSFTTPLFLALIYYLHTRRYVAATAVVLFSGLFYPPSLPVAALTYTFSIVSWQRRESNNREIRWPPLLYLLLALTIVGASQIRLILAQLDSVHAAALYDSTRLHILRDPTYAPGGRRALFFIFPLVGRGGLVTHHRAALQLGLLAIAATLTWLTARDRAYRLPGAGCHLFWASVIVFSGSWLAIILFSSFLLYIPSRHTQSSFFVLLVLYVTINLRATFVTLAGHVSRARRILPWLALPGLLLLASIGIFLPQIQPFWYKHTPWMPLARWLIVGLTAVLTILTFLTLRTNPTSTSQTPTSSNYLRARFAAGIFLLSLAFFYAEALRPITYNPSDDKRALFRFVETLPKDALFAGDPCTLDDIPFYARRSVVFNCEIYRGDALILDSLRAYYAPDGASLASYCSEYGVDYFIVNARTLSSETIAARSYFFAPYTEALAPELAGREQFYLQELTTSASLFNAGDISVIACPADTRAD